MLYIQSNFTITLDFFRNSLMVVQEMALRRAGKMIFDECLWICSTPYRKLGKLREGLPAGPPGARRAGASTGVMPEDGGYRMFEKQL
jgi:hypothetical protein